MKSDPRLWIVCQLGGRESYAIARALHRRQALAALVTDIWSPPWNWSRWIGSQRVSARYQRELATAGSLIRSWNAQSLLFECKRRTRHAQPWERILARNAFFQEKACTALEKLAPRLRGRNVTLFAYSYAALKLLDFARKQKWKTVLGQIDGGPEEERFVQKLQLPPDGRANPQETAPAFYWEQWRKECARADVVMANSEWSAHKIAEAGVEPNKIQVVPLSLEPPSENVSFQRNYPPAFCQERPLRVLFLGQLIARKGLGPLLEATELLRDHPVEFWLAGTGESEWKGPWRNNPRVHWMGPVDRRRAGLLYRHADVFILPTFSDGFAITQLEALSWKLPIITSSFCGKVVRHESNGLVLPQVSASAIVQALCRCLEKPALLASFSQEANLSPLFSLHRLVESLLSLPTSSA